MLAEFKELEAKRTHKFKLAVEKRQEMILSIQKQLGDSTKKTQMLMQQNLEINLILLIT